MTDFVHIKLPDTDGVAVSTQEAFDQVWEPAGYVIATDDEVAAGMATSEPAAPDYTSFKKDDLEALAVSRGIDVSDKPNKDELTDRLVAPTTSAQEG